MSKLYSKLAVDGRWRYAVTRRAHRRATSQLASWHGAIETEIVHNNDGSITYTVRKIPWHGVGDYEQIAEGVLKSA